MTLDMPIGKLYGVGPKYEKHFAMGGLYTVEDLLYYFPRAYQNRADICSLASASFDSAPHAYILTVASDVKVAMIRRGMNILKFKAFDESGTVEITYFNQNYLKEVFKKGATFRFWGKVTKEKRTLCMNSPSYEAYTEARPLDPFVSVYPLFSGMNQKYLSRLIGSICDEIQLIVKDHLPEKIRLENGLCTLAYALKNIHFPESNDALERAMRRLTFDELFLFALSASQIKTVSYAKLAPKMKEVDLSPLLSQMPYELTDAQKRTIFEIQGDMCAKFASNPSNSDKYIPLEFTIKPMNRIIVGDVGSGKTICAASSAFIACKNGYQCALMVPTEILAFQHFEDLKPLFENAGVSCELLTGSTPAKAKKEILSRLKSGETSFVIGTHALIQESVEFKNLGLVITDEQHRFGVMQRARLAEKSKSAHVLVMSATPIPRTLSLMIYGDLDISLIDEMPRGRQRVDTFVVDEGYRTRLNGFIRKQVEGGNQVYVVCPSVEEKKDDILESADFNPFIINFKDTPPLKATVDYAKELSENVFPDLNVGFLHGKMKAKEKDAIMMDFANRKIDILVSTTVIEVGVNVPNATLMVVENAERFGLSQLHQLRGRVGRGKDKSYCILVSNSRSDASRERLEIMRTTYDGYTIAERDLKMRGPGDFFSNSSGIRQSGEVSFNIAKSCSDEALLHCAFESARAVLKDDKSLSKAENAPLLAKVEKICNITAKTIN